MTPHDNTLYALDLSQRARTALACLHLTTLNNAATAAANATLCLRARSPVGSLSSLCVPRRPAAV